MKLTYTNYLVHLFKALKDFVLAYHSTADDNVGIRNNKKYFLPRAGIKNYSLLIDGRNFYDNQLMI